MELHISKQCEIIENQVLPHKGKRKKKKKVKKKRKRNMMFSLVNGLRRELVMGLDARCISRLSTMRWAILCIEARPICLIPLASMASEVVEGNYFL